MIPNATKTTGVELTTIADLTPDERNANRGTQRGLAMLEDSLRRHGAGRSILVDKHGRVIAGNKTLESAASIGLEDVVIVKTDGTKIVAVQRTDIDLDTPEGRRLAVADNRTSEVGLDWDVDKLTELLSEGLDTDGLFSAEELSDLLAVEPEPKDAPDAQLDRAEELRAQWGTERGQVWRVGPHRLMCGDSTDAGDVATLMDGAKPLLTVTDPPYGVDYDPEWRNEAAEKGFIAYAASSVGKPTNDDRADWSETWALCPSDVLYCWHADRHASCVQSSLEAAAFEIRWQIIWAKPSFAIGRGHYNCQHEPCWYAVRKGASTHWCGDHSQTTLWQVNRDRSEGGHSTQKPVECMARAIRNHNGDVYDPFLGSGTTMVAAEQLGRVCYGMEIEPRYVAVALQRMADMGLTPERA